MSAIGFATLKINSEEDLRRILSEFPEIKSDKWIKSVSALYTEVKEGECVLGVQDNNLVRRVRVVAINCFHTNNHGERLSLYEEKQVFTDGRVRNRDMEHVAEKLKHNETPEEGARRGLAEELQIEGPDIQLKALEEENQVTEEDSPSYKGIRTIYNTYVFSCEVPGSHFKESYVEVQNDKSTYFQWKKM